MTIVQMLIPTLLAVPLERSLQLHRSFAIARSISSSDAVIPWRESYWACSASQRAATALGMESIRRMVTKVRAPFWPQCGRFRAVCATSASASKRFHTTVARRATSC